MSSADKPERSRCTCGQTDWSGFHCGVCHHDFRTREEIIGHWDRDECPPSFRVSNPNDWPVEERDQALADGWIRRG